jgi:Tol biopolymer transport system component
VDILISDSDGSSLRQLTDGPGVSQGSPTWSPDGRRIAFDSFVEGRYTLWVIDVDGGVPQPLASSVAREQVVPVWSRDGGSIYFAGGRWGAFAIWRVPAVGGTAERLTPEGTGRFTAETHDGTQLVYQAADDDSALMVVPVSGGEPRQVVACAKNAAFGVGAQGVYYAACDATADPPLHVLNLATGEDRVLGRLEQFERSPILLSLGLSISPDGTSVLYPRTVNEGSDLMLLENFRSTP